MKQRGYRVAIKPDSVVVEHRASFQPRTVGILFALYAGYCLLPAVKRVLTAFWRGHDPVVGGFSLFFLLIPFLAGFTWLMFQSGEVFRCDRETLKVAQRRTLGRWHRRTFQSQGTRLSWTLVFRSKGRSYEAIQIDSARGALRILEDLSREEALKVLNVCKGMGWNVKLPKALPVIDDSAMKADISKHGWFVNPWRPDAAEVHPKEQK